MSVGIDETSRLLGEIEARLDGIDARLKRVDTKMDDMVAIKNKGWGALAVMATLSAFFGAKIAAMLSGIGGLIK